MLKVTDYTIAVFENDKEEVPYLNWLHSLDWRTQERIQQRVDRIRHGNFGDYKSIDGNIYELRLFFGSGYRIYFGKDGEKLIILLAGGDKATQTKDIKNVKICWKQYMEDKNGNQ
jgi:putative addiction module killer protein